MLVATPAKKPSPEVKPVWFDLEFCMRYALKHLPGRESSLKYFNLDMEYTTVPGVFRPSGLRGCTRAVLYKTAGIQARRPNLEIQQRLTFDRGHILGALMAAYVRLAQDYPELGITDVIPNENQIAEVVTHCPSSDLGGKVDIAFRKDDIPYFCEVKSKMDPTAYKKLTSPMKVHQAQLNDYMGMTIHDPNVESVRAGFVIYTGPDFKGLDKQKRPKVCSKCERGHNSRLDFKVFYVEYCPKIWEESNQHIHEIHQYLENPERLPPMPDKFAFDPCTSCKYQEEVCGQTLVELLG